jgi:D-alanyl-D-alanine dipeptidase
MTPSSVTHKEAAQNLGRFTRETALAELNAVIAQAFQPWAHQLELL